MGKKRVIPDGTNIVLTKDIEIVSGILQVGTRLKVLKHNKDYYFCNIYCANIGCAIKRKELEAQCQL